jgi:hypothetical protein
MTTTGIAAAMATTAQALLPHVGSRWHWEPMDLSCSEVVEVTAVEWNGEEWWIESKGPQTVEPAWNSWSRWIEATIFVEAE